MIKDIIETEYGINIKHPSYNRYKDLINQNKQFIPEFNHKSLEFKMINVPYALANGLRRVMTNEIDMKHMSIDFKEIKTNDEYLFPDLIKDRIEMVPLLQTISNDVTFSLNVENYNTDVVKNIYSKDIISSDGKIYFNSTYKICSIRSGKQINIKNIKVEEHNGYYHDGKFSATTVGYEVISNFSEPTLERITDDFKLVVNTNGNIEPRKVIEKACDYMITKMNKFKTNVINLNENIEDINIDNNVKLIFEENVVRYFIDRETYTLGELLRTYIYLEDPSIELVNTKVPHVTEKKIIVSIIHKNQYKIMVDAIDKIIYNFNLIKGKLYNEK